MRDKKRYNEKTNERTNVERTIADDDNIPVRTLIIRLTESDDEKVYQNIFFRSPTYKTDPRQPTISVYRSTGRRSVGYLK